MSRQPTVNHSEYAGFGDYPNPEDNFRPAFSTKESVIIIVHAGRSEPDTMIHTKRLNIRTIRVEDAGAVFEIYKHPETCRYFDILPYTDRTQAEHRVKTWLNNADERKQFRYAICLNNAEGTLIGTCGLYSLYWHQKRTSLGYDLNPAYWSQGYMTEALSAFIPFCAETYGIHRFQALAIPENGASANVLRKLGFEREGLLRDYEIWEGRGYVDLEMYARLVKTSG